MRLNITNRRLKKQVQELEVQKDDTNSTVVNLGKGFDKLEDTNEELKEKVVELKNVPDELNATTIVYTAFNKNLTIVISKLEFEKEILKTEVDKLTGINQNLEMLKINLTEIVQELNDTSVDQRELLVKLQKNLVDLTAENDRLEDLNEDIVLIIALVESDSYKGGDTVSNVETWLEGDIQNRERQLYGAKSTLIRNYAQDFESRKDQWFCNFEYEFYGYELGKPQKALTHINASYVDQVYLYIENRFLSPHCLDRENFIAYDQYKNMSVMSMHNLKKTINGYASLVHDYYFPSKATISIEQWKNASYECESLKNNYYWVKQFVKPLHGIPAPSLHHLIFFIRGNTVANRFIGSNNIQAICHLHSRACIINHFPAKELMSEVILSPRFIGVILPFLFEEIQVFMKPIHIRFCTRHIGFVTKLGNINCSVAILVISEILPSPIGLSVLIGISA